jgi:hypothetical protein
MSTEARRFGYFVAAGTQCPGCGSASGGCHVQPDGRSTLCVDGRHVIPSPGHNGDGQHQQPDPVPKSPDVEHPWRPFPLNALPPVISEFAAEVARTMHVDPVMAALPMLTIAGACIGNTARVRMKDGWDAPANVWSAIAVRSGEKKSPVLGAIMKPLHDRQTELAEQHAEVTAQYDTEIEQWKSSNKKTRGDEPLSPAPFPHQYVQDSTTEAVAIRLHDHPRGLPMVMDELAALFSGMNQYRSGGRGHDRETYLGFYDARPVKIDRKTATPPTIYIPSAFVGITGMIQPEALAQAMGPAEFFTGMAARFLLASPPPIQGRWTDEGISELIRDAWRDSLYAILGVPLQDKPILIPVSSEAMRLFSQAYDRLEADRFSEPDGRMRAARAKLNGAIPRIALIHDAMTNVVEGGSIRSISDRAMRSAIEMVEWCIYETRRVYGILANEGDEDEVLRLIESFGGVITPRRLAQRVRSVRTVDAAESYLSSLVKDGMGRWQFLKPSPKGGRPSKVFVLKNVYDNPDYELESEVS